MNKLWKELLTSIRSVTISSQWVYCSRPGVDRKGEEESNNVEDARVMIKHSAFQLSLLPDPPYSTHPVSNLVIWWTCPLKLPHSLSSWWQAFAKQGTSLCQVMGWYCLSCWSVRVDLFWCVDEKSTRDSGYLKFWALNQLNQSHVYLSTPHHD